MSEHQPVCDHCGNFDLQPHCDSPTCPWQRCTRTACRAVGHPGHMRRPQQHEEA